MLILLSGVSASGKGTVIGELVKNNPNIKFFKSATTREPRPNENAYIYLSLQEFENRKAKGDFFETELVHGNYYGVLNQTLDLIINNQEQIYIKDIDVHGMERLAKRLKEQAKVLTFFLDAPDEVLYQRLLKRGESDERAKIRLQRGELERAYKNQYDYVIENLDLQTTVKFIEEKIKNA